MIGSYEDVTRELDRVNTRLEMISDWADKHPPEHLEESDLHPVVYYIKNAQNSLERASGDARRFSNGAP
jgi:hypothetical protein